MIPIFNYPRNSTVFHISLGESKVPVQLASSSTLSCPIKLINFTSNSEQTFLSKIKSSFEIEFVTNDCLI